MFKEPHNLQSTKKIQLDRWSIGAEGRLNEGNDEERSLANEG